MAPIALCNAFKYSYPDVVASNSSSLLVDVGARTTDLIYIQGDRIFTRSIQVGGAAASSAIAKEFDLDFAEAENMKLQSGMVSPNYFEKELNTKFGSGFSIQPKFSQSAYFRFHNKSEIYDGLYFVGAGTHPGAGVPGVLSSAKVLDKII